MIDFMVLFQLKSSQHICFEVRLIIGSSQAGWNVKTHQG